ncbi:hypothetical protein C499_05323 [Halogeometricum borinquense DSM 11551]|uniref:Uncharacterized protein n=1 Tax=Halogeometricum borinquense (strain ATCC 700274 / DSM 11551 / JCM 10706 / KCTC 4070 / PR3) TaxID=469382 RepID=E4NKZ8_HALBP|nr:hypothetical protein [Halogeometricum borinquense]ADQ67150.1 hypothetical protein Hbor_15800 [Halogeometricum borinquense DSM 11551]ELY29698.1 hypothetical protein C499_05323 [Halogeometricum borinquense DSM 11551]
MLRTLARHLRPAVAACLRQFGSLAVTVVGVAALSRPVLAHAGSLAGSLQSAPVPFWLVVLSGGGVVGVSFLFSSFVTDTEILDAVANQRRRLDLSKSLIRSNLSYVGPVVSLAVLAAVVWFGVTGPAVPLANFAVLTVWVGWWAGFTMFTYLVVNLWPLVNPWRALARAVGRSLSWQSRFSRESRPLSERVGSWPAVVGLITLVWVEVVSPVASNPQTLAVAVLGYTAVTVGGAVRYGSAWFERIDPVTRVFHLYGLLAPIQRDGDGISVSVPGSVLARYPKPMRDGEVAFVVALLWVTTYDGFVATVAWQELQASVVAVGIPGWLLSLAIAFVGFACFLAVYRVAARVARRTADTYVTADFVARWFAPALLPIAAGYHLAHFLGYFLGLAPAFVAVATAPLSPPAAIPVLALPSWFGAVQLGFVVGGHLLAIWIAHTRSFDVFPGRLQPLRSQYPFVAVTVLYTMTSLWVVAQPVADSLP